MVHFQVMAVRGAKVKAGKGGKGGKSAGKPVLEVEQDAKKVSSTKNITDKRPVPPYTLQ